MAKHRHIPCLTQSDIARFLAKIAPPNANGCRLWTASTADGYGQFLLGTRRVPGSRLIRAHRVAYTLWVGPIPDGMQIDHTCFNRACVAPLHLRAVSSKQNNEHRSGPQPASQTGVRGVSPETRNGRKRWKATVGHQGRAVSLGRFDTIEEAEAVVVAARQRLFTHDDGATYSG